MHAQEPNRLITSYPDLSSAFDLLSRPGGTYVISLVFQFVGQAYFLEFVEVEREKKERGGIVTVL